MIYYITQIVFLLYKLYIFLSIYGIYGIKKPAKKPVKNLVAGAGFEPTTSGL